MIVVKEEFVGGPKWRRAVKLVGSDAVAMWLALKCYTSQHPSSEGFVPAEDIADLPGAPKNVRKALQGLMACGRLMPDGSRGPGLVDSVDEGWQLHDYLDHSVAPEEIELRRERARLKKQRQREDKKRELEEVRSLSRDVSRGQPGDDDGDSPGDDDGDAAEDVPEDALAGARPPEPAPTRAGAPPHSNPAHSNPPHESEIRSSRAHKTYTMPCEKPPKEFLDEALMDGVSREQAASTWSHYYGAGLPEFGVERLYHWLSQRAKERAIKLASVRPSASSRGGPAHEDPGTRGHLRLEPQSEHRRLAEQHGIDLQDLVNRLNRDPKTQALSTVAGWALLTTLLERAAARRLKVGGAA